MAENKKSFVLYADLIGNIEHLTNEEKGILFNHLLEYVNDKNPFLEDRLILTAWKPIERQLKRDLLKYEKTKEERSKSGQLGNLKRYHLDLYERVNSESITLIEAQRIAKTRIAEHSDTKLADNVNDNDNDNVNDNVNDIKENKKNNVFNFRKSLLSLGAKENLVSDWIKVRKSKKATNTETAFNGFKKQLELSNRDINEILEICINNSWSGFKKDWIKDEFKENKINNPSNEKIITYTSNVDPQRRTLIESEFLEMQESMRDGGYIFKILE